MPDPETLVPSVPFHRPYLTGGEASNLRQALASGHLRGDGPFSERCAGRLRDLTGAAAVLMTPSCTDALELAALTLGIGPGDEVVMPSFTFAATANAVAVLGARPVFVDVDPHTLCIDPDAVAAAIGPRTRAVVPVHYGGAACRMDRLGALADEHGLAVVEDAAHGLGGTWRDRPLGGIGALGALSFHETKNLQCGEGGALVVNDPDLVERAIAVRDQGTNRRSFLRGEVDHYTWTTVGSAFLMGELAAAVLAAQLDGLEHVQTRRRQVWDAYRSGLADWASGRGVELPVTDPADRHAVHVFHLLLPTAEDRTRFLSHLRAAGVGSSFHYLPLHRTDVARRLGHVGELPVTDSVAARLARLPLHPDLTTAEVDRVLDAVRSFPG